MTSWTWHNPRWQDSVRDDAEATVRDALRRAVDLRDTLEAGSRDTARVLLLVDMLNDLAELQGVDTSALWERLRGTGAQLGAQPRAAVLARRADYE
jgi:hypothetical protein